jgi:hypothetical protein
VGVCGCVWGQVCLDQAGEALSCGSGPLVRWFHARLRSGSSSSCCWRYGASRILVSGVVSGLRKNAWAFCRQLQTNSQCVHNALATSSSNGRGLAVSVVLDVGVSCWCGGAGRIVGVARGMVLFV